MLTFGSLFAGIGGFDLGFSAMKCVWQVEINKQCNAVRRRHWPDVPQFEDVRNFRAKDAVRPDLICGGFPCQDLSVAGRRAGLAGERSGLFYEFARCLAEFTPGWVCIENVPGLLSSNEGRDMGAVVGTLAQLGYRWAYRVLDAQYFGVAQRRRRVFIVGSLGNRPHPAEILFDTESLPGNPPSRRETGARTARATCYRTSGNCGVMPQGDRTAALNCESDPNQQIIAGTLQSHSKEHGHAMTTQQAAESNQLVAFGGNNTKGPIDVATACNAKASASGRQDFESETFVAFAQNQRDEIRDLQNRAGALAAEPGMKQQTFVMQERMEAANPKDGPQGKGWSDDGVAFTLEARSKTQSVAHAGVRRLTPRERERLQGFPDDFTRYDADGNEISDSARYRMLGNAVAVPVAEWIGRRIVEAVNSERG